jgi:hypothetical protein
MLRIDGCDLQTGTVCQSLCGSKMSEEVTVSFQDIEFIGTLLFVLTTIRPASGILASIFGSVL